MPSFLATRPQIPTTDVARMVSLSVPLKLTAQGGAAFPSEALTDTDEGQG